jgi:hypothetical protein
MLVHFQTQKIQLHVTFSCYMIDNSIKWYKLINHIYNMTMDYYFNLFDPIIWSIDKWSNLYFYIKYNFVSYSY